MKKSLHIICVYALLGLAMQAGCSTQPTGNGDTNGNDNTNGDTTVQGGTLYYSRTDGAVAALDVTTQEEVAVILSSAFIGGVPGAGREIAFDPVTRLMWYSATDGLLHSVNVDTLVAGPEILEIPGANEGVGRHVYIDYSRRRILTPITDGSIQMYDLADQSDAGSIPATFFTDGNVGGLRHLASDIRDGNIWYAATDGSFREMDPDTVTNTGREISFGEQVGADPGAFRHFVIDPDRDLLLYSVTDGSIASIDLTTLQAASLTISSGSFSGGDPGAARIITYDDP